MGHTFICSRSHTPLVCLNFPGSPRTLRRDFVPSHRYQRVVVVKVSDANFCLQKSEKTFYCVKKLRFRVGIPLRLVSELIVADKNGRGRAIAAEESVGQQRGRLQLGRPEVQSRAQLERSR